MRSVNRQCERDDVAFSAWQLTFRRCKPACRMQSAQRPPRLSSAFSTLPAGMHLSCAHGASLVRAPSGWPQAGGGGPQQARDRQADRQAGRQADGHADSQADTPADSPADRQAGGQADS